MPVRKGTDLVLQLHVHPSGKEETDQSSIALYFADKPVERTMSRAPFLVGSLMIDIPAGAREHTITSSVTLPTDVTLISLMPHMHLVGKEMKLTATLPDGKVEHVDLDQGLEFLLAGQLRLSRAGPSCRPARSWTS